MACIGDVLSCRSFSFERRAPQAQGGTRRRQSSGAERSVGSAAIWEFALALGLTGGCESASTVMSLVQRFLEYRVAPLVHARALGN